jgi:hypothetical protein
MGRLVAIPPAATKDQPDLLPGLVRDTRGEGSQRVPAHHGRTSQSGLGSVDGCGSTAASAGIERAASGVLPRHGGWVAVGLRVGPAAHPYVHARGGRTFIVARATTGSPSWPTSAGLRCSLETATHCRGARSGPAPAHPAALAQYHGQPSRQTGRVRAGWRPRTADEPIRSCRRLRCPVGRRYWHSRRYGQLVQARLADRVDRVREDRRAEASVQLLNAVLGSQ